MQIVVKFQGPEIDIPQLKIQIVGKFSGPRHGGVHWVPEQQVPGKSCSRGQFGKGHDYEFDEDHDDDDYYVNEDHDNHVDKFNAH